MAGGWGAPELSYLWRCRRLGMLPAPNNPAAPELGQVPSRKRPVNVSRPVNVALPRIGFEYEKWLAVKLKKQLSMHQDMGAAFNLSQEFQKRQSSARARALSKAVERQS